MKHGLHLNSDLKAVCAASYYSQESFKQKGAHLCLPEQTELEESGALVSLVVYAPAPCTEVIVFIAAVAGLIRSHDPFPSGLPPFSTPHDSCLPPAVPSIKAKMPPKPHLKRNRGKAEVRLQRYS